MINIGQYIETLINWMMIHFSTFFDALNLGIGSFINGFQHILFGIPFYLTIAAMVLLAWAKAGRGVAVFTLLGLLLIYGMGFWEATMQTLALVLSSTCLALIVGVPIGVWTANSNRAEKDTSHSRPDADHASLRLSDSCCFVFRPGSGSGSICYNHLCDASGDSPYRAWHPSGAKECGRGFTLVRSYPMAVAL